MSILIIEDDREIRETLSDLLQFEGYEVKSVTNGREGIDFLKKSTVAPKLILLDLMMPVMDGEEFRSAQLADTKLARIPTVLLSAASQLESKASRAGFTDYMPKPIDLDHLLGFVDRYCRPS